MARTNDYQVVWPPGFYSPINGLSNFVNALSNFVNSASTANSNLANTKQHGSEQLTNASGNPNLTTNIQGAGLVLVSSNNLGLWTITGLTNPSVYYNFNGSQFGTNGDSGTNVSIKSGVLVSNVVLWSSNNTSVPLVVTNQAGSISDVMSAYNTNRAGFRVRSNGVMEVKATATGANPSMMVHNDGANQTYTVWTNSNGGNGFALMRCDNAGNIVFSSGTAGGDIYFGSDGGSGEVYFQLTGVGNTFSIIPSSTVAALHGTTSRRSQFTNIWDIWCRTNISVARTNLTGHMWVTNSSYMETNTASFDITTNDFVLNQYYTNGNQRSWVAANISHTNVLALDKSSVGLYLDQDASGAFERTGIITTLQGVATLAGVEELSAFLQPNARFIFTNLSSGTATATIEPNSSQWVNQ